MNIETILTPLELSTLPRQDLRETACVVFDILRATSTFVTALHHGARAVIPVSEIPEALALRQREPDALLAGERNGVKIHGVQPGGIDFDFGNSPREFGPENVHGRTIISTTTNGTRALRACAPAKIVLAGAFLNLNATAAFLTRLAPARVLLTCSGTANEAALEDMLAAGALATLLGGHHSDATALAARAYHSAQHDLPGVIAGSKNGRRLLAIPELHDDVAFCALIDLFPRAARMGADGAIRLV